jgi:hypothetical protein
MARRPRKYSADSVYAEVQRTVDRQFLFKPDPTIRNIIGACAGRALRKYPVKLFWLDFNINHKQAGRAPLSNDPEHIQNLVRFDQLFNSLLARELNRHHHREGALYSTRNRSQECIDDPSLEQQLLYAVTNVVKDGLVDRVAHWKGVSSYQQLATGERDRYRYINWSRWWAAGGRRSKRSPEEFVEWVEVELSPLPSWEGMKPAQRQAHFRRLVRQLEQELRAQREREGRRVMGPRKLARVDPRGRPLERKPRTPQPLCHASTAAGRRQYEQDWREFLREYYAASARYRSGEWEVEFPAGTFRPPLIEVCAALPA